MPNEDKTKFSIRIDSELVQMMDEHLEKSPYPNRTGFIEDAIRHYLGYLRCQDDPAVSHYLTPTVSSVITSSIKCMEDRISSLLYKTAVEISMLNHITAYTSGGDIDDITLRRLLVECQEEVKSINGAISFGAANRFLKGR